MFRPVHEGRLMRENVPKARRRRQMWWVCKVHGRVCTAGDEFTRDNIRLHEELLNYDEPVVSAGPGRVGRRAFFYLRSTRNAGRKFSPEVKEGPW